MASPFTESTVQDAALAWHGVGNSPGSEVLTIVLSQRERLRRATTEGRRQA
ncbi:MAG: hypothetical protein KatS3mg082_3351 [Nitrospiraceae bacterium]|nr:MAG: hypothetical protein KatS3mg082_3351 [Nitrospiraceae bacterium]